MKRNNDQWTSKLNFILASAGAAIGLGAIWKLPYVTGMNGGGAFFLIFVIFTVLIGLPMLISEFIIGRGAKKEAVTAYKTWAPDSLWVWIGRLGLVGCFLLLTFYSVVGGWVLMYTVKSLIGGVIQSGVDYEAVFGEMVGSPSTTIFGLAIFTLLNVLVISFGVRNGIEKANKYMMPLLFIFFIILVVRSITLDGAMEGISFFLKPDFSNITGSAILYALGQSFFSLAVGFSCMVTYSSSLEKDVNLTTSAGSVVTMNIFVSLLAGLAIFPVVFAFGFEPTEGPGLLFIVLPAAFAQLPFGQAFLTIFLLLFLFATLTSSFSLYEIIVAALKESGVPRAISAIFLGIIIFIAAIPSALAESILSDVSIFGNNIFDATDFLVSNILLPIGSILIAIFIIHRADKKLVQKEYEIANSGRSYYGIWRALMTWVVPVTIILAFLNTLGIM